MIIDGITTADGTELSTAELNKIDDATPKGTILQVLQTHVTGQTTQPLDAQTITELTGIAVTITPKSATSKILVTVMWNGEISVSPWNTVFGLKRDSTYIGAPAQIGSRNYGIATPTISYHSTTDNDSTPESCNYNYLDSPATILPITYKATIRTFSSGNISNNSVF